MNIPARRPTPAAHTTPFSTVQGMSTLITVLGACLVIAVLLSMTATVILGNQRGVADNRAALEAQYAAESSLARAQATADAFADVLNSIQIAKGTQQDEILTGLGAVCGMPGKVTLPANVPNLPPAGNKLCTPPGLSGAAKDNQLAFLRDRTKIPPGLTDAQWKGQWRNMFSGSSGVLVTTSASTQGTASGTLTTEVRGGLSIQSVTITPDNKVRLVLQSTPLVSTATLQRGGRIVAQRRYSSGGLTTREIVISQPPFSQYQYFVNRRTLPGTTATGNGGRLVFWDEDTFEGRVHANGAFGSTAPVFWASAANRGPRFLGKYTSTSATLEYSTAARPSADTMFTGGYQLGVDAIDLPTNANDQRLATTGIQPGNCPNTAACLNTVFGSGAATSGVFYAPGTAATPNSGGSFGQSGKGGIFVKGNVDNLTLSKTGSFQRIEIVQGGKTTRFDQTGPNSWNVYENGVLKKTMGGTFNGMVYVDGNIGTQTPAGSGGLKGDGTGNPDIAATSQMTVAATGDIFIKDDITYTDAPSVSDSKNVLGVYSEKGNVKVNGPLNRDITINGTLMAATTGKGFGTVDYTTARTTGTTTPKINLTGGIIEEQSQGVGQVGTPGRGYSRNFKWDPRLASGLTPPFFPTQGAYEAAPDFTELTMPRTFRAEGM
ncbi:MULTISPECIES: hypothetical protein [Deinococcus]|uniref:Type II secretory pathway pseudopilin PulG n=2 Tax=Deinococcus soli (ex Cha et al. 2016) TaxID=1309411 RepID=A0ACC6KK34_9DEIO|nr:MULTISPECIES: hypothetical protein [Deinococcus]MDK2012849.1 hypothetical protein [Deinococcus sp. 43]MDR6219912.1 type II secretory pathway pseudopilin PulG [Deinococcus soli (ex Cha et al. 2016)]MDR6329830.1 type II secretory pathway pseudopilin PulG [Deinococcus soli (ex Cha et al. 2016)]MDR6752819.1 type II secretory pathway pseudopilin PulG [Deinococcus soli (ex Cha et al. 2016)]GGB63361.1 hypothetical protein GCM10008019_19250 [Deinococcus soli (ex Cha et al. 2016)]